LPTADNKGDAMIDHDPIVEVRDQSGVLLRMKLYVLLLMTVKDTRVKNGRMFFRETLGRPLTFLLDGQEIPRPGEVDMEG